jgi:hypothetical protein
VIIFMIGSTDRLFFRLGISYTAQIHFWRAGVWGLPLIVFALALWISRSQPPRRIRSGWDGDRAGLSLSAHQIGRRLL